MSSLHCTAQACCSKGLTHCSALCLAVICVLPGQLVRAQWIPWGHNIHIFQAVPSSPWWCCCSLSCPACCQQLRLSLSSGLVLYCTTLWILPCTVPLHYTTLWTILWTVPPLLNNCTVNTTLYSNHNTKLENLALSQTVFLQFTFCTKHIFLKHLLLSSVAIFICDTDLIQCLKLNQFSVFPSFY